MLLQLPSVSCSRVDAPNTRSSKLPPSRTVSRFVQTRLSVLPNSHLKLIYAESFVRNGLLEASAWARYCYVAHERAFNGMRESCGNMDEYHVFATANGKCEYRYRYLTDICKRKIQVLLVKNYINSTCLFYILESGNSTNDGSSNPQDVRVGLRTLTPTLTLTPILTLRILTLPCLGTCLGR